MLKKIFLGVFATVLAFTAIVGSLTLSTSGTVTASADELSTAKAEINNETYPMNDDNLEFINGASLQVPTFLNMRFKLQLNNPDFRKVKDNHIYTFTFDFLRVNDGINTLISQYIIMMDGAHDRYYLVKKDFCYAKETLSAKDSFLPSINGKKRMDAFFSDLSKDCADENYQLLDYGYVDSEGGLAGYDILNFIMYDGVPQLHLYVECDGYFSEYKLRLSYNETLVEKYTTTEGWWWEKHEVEKEKITLITSSTLDSTSRSPKWILDQMYADESLGEAFYAQYPIAKEIALIDKKKTVTVSYLEPIGNSPFARKVSKEIELFMSDNHLSLDDVSSALGVSYLSCLESLPFELVHVSELNYEVVYSKAVWINASTVDGNSANYFLDINKSFEEFYQPYVDEKIISADMYSWFFNEVKSLCPSEVGNYTPNEIYGFWGFLAIPYTYSLNQLWAEFFGNKTEYAGVTHHFKYNDRISQVAYNKLLTEFNYGWTGHIWNSICTWVDNDENASFFLFYNENGQDGVISNSGSTDPEDNDGLIQNKGEEIVGDIANGINNIASNIANGIKTLGAKLKSPLGVVILIVILGVIGYILYLKFFRGKK